MFCGAQFSIYPMSDDFVSVILGAIEGLADRTDIRIETDDISTLVVGTPDAVFGTVAEVFEKASRLGGHVVCSATFSRGCPGEPDDPICTVERPTEGTPRPLELTDVPSADIPVAAHFSLYPLGIGGYMDTIVREIGFVKQSGITTSGKHFCTKMRGDLRRVFALMQRSFENAAHDAGHVVVTATVSKGSPSGPVEQGE